MPITRTQIHARKNTCTLEYAGETVNIEYFPAGVDATKQDFLQGWSERAKAASGNDEATAELMQEFGTWAYTVLASWDYLQEDGSPVPITPESLAAEASGEYGDFVMKVIAACFADNNQGNG